MFVLVVESARKLLVLAKIPRLSQSQIEEYIELMKKLRAEGFSSHEIEVLTNGRWKEATIKRHTRGVEKMKSGKKDEIIETFARYVSRGYDSDYIEHFMKVDNMIKGAGQTFENVVEFIIEVTNRKVNLVDLILFKQELDTYGLTIENVKKYSLIIEELQEMGITYPEIKKIKEVTDKYIGLERILNAINNYNSIESINMELSKLNVEKKKVENEINAFKNEKNKIIAENLLFNSYIQIVKKLVDDYSFNLDSFTTLLETAKKYENPETILEAINSYIKLGLISKEVISAMYRLNHINDEIKIKEAKLDSLNKLIEKANREIGEINAAFKQSLRLQELSNLLQNPREMNLDPEEFLRICNALLGGMLEYGSSHKTALPDWDKNIKFFIENAMLGITEILSR